MIDSKRDLTGQRFGFWLVTGYAGLVKTRPHWTCLCDCGKIKAISYRSLQMGVSTSCRCRYSGPRNTPLRLVSEKLCKDCKIVKPASEFHSHIQTLDRLGTYCKDCHRIRISQWAKNVGKEYWREWRKQNPGKASYYAKSEKEKFPGRRQARELKYRQLKPWVWIESNARRRAMKKRACPKWANRFFISEAYELAQQRTKITGFKWHVDHIVPLKSDFVCGLHVEKNLQVIPGHLNIGKLNRSWPDMPNA